MLIALSIILGLYSLLVGCVLLYNWRLFILSFSRQETRESYIFGVVPILSIVAALISNSMASAFSINWWFFAIPVILDPPTLVVIKVTLFGARAKDAT